MPSSRTRAMFGIKDLLTTVNLLGGVAAVCLCIEGRPYDAGVAIMLGYFLGDADGEPPEVAHLRHRDVAAHLHPDLRGPEVERDVLVVDPELGGGDAEHGGLLRRGSW